MDQAPFALTGGLVVHPLEPQVLYAGPGKEPVAVLPAAELGGPTWVPVVQASPAGLHGAAGSGGLRVRVAKNGTEGRHPEVRPVYLARKI